MVDNFIENLDDITTEDKIDVNFIAKLDGFIKYLKIVKTNALENKLSSRSKQIIDKTITQYYNNSIKSDNYENQNYFSFDNILDDESSSINSNDVEFVETSDNEESNESDDNEQVNPYNTFSQNYFEKDREKEPVKIDENIEQKKINFSSYKFYQNKENLEKRYKKYIENCFKY